VTGVNNVAVAVAALFDGATAEEARSLEGLTAALQSVRGRRIEVIDVDDLPLAVCGRWGSAPTCDTLSLRKGLPSRSWTLAHELGHVALGHVGRPVVEAGGADVSAANTSLVEYMLNRGGTEGDVDVAQEDEAEAFAGLLMARMRLASRSSAPYVHARLSDTLG
jgi:hypothetical protein